MFTLPSTPGYDRKHDLSTTPSRPPPTDYTSKTFTPAGLPQSANLAPKSIQLFGQAPGGPSLFQAPDIGATSSHYGGFAVPSSSLLTGREHELDLALERELFETGTANLVNGHTNGSLFNGLDKSYRNNTMVAQNSPRASKRSRNGMTNSMLGNRAERLLSNRGSTVSNVAKSLAATIPPKHSLQEADDVVLRTERVLTSLNQSLRDGDGQDQSVNSANQASKELLTIWASHTQHESIAASIGPLQETDFARAVYIASLALQIHHPSQLDPRYDESRPVSTVWSRHRARTPVPQVLLDWLNKNHNPYPGDLDDVLSTQPSWTANDRFWDTVFSTMLRGNLDQTIHLLDNADFADAETALEDGYTEPGYRGRQLTSAHQVVARCVEVLRLCPAFTDNNWVVKGAEWSLFRSRVSRASEDLETFAEEDGADRDTNVDKNLFQSSRFGESISAANRRAESKVPWTIYQQLKVLYGQLLGRRDEIVDSAQDWLEAVIYLTTWWDGDETEVMGRASHHGTRSIRQLRGQQTRETDVSPVAAYKRRLLISIADVTDQPQDVELGINTMDPVQVALACVLEGETAGYVSLLQAWSMPVAAALVEIGSTAGWIAPSQFRGRRNMMEGFDQDDLMVLNHDQDHDRVTILDRDQVMSDYADLLARADKLSNSAGRDIRAGWEVAVRVLSRLDRADAAEAKIGKLFEGMELCDSQQVDTALSVCAELGLPGQAYGIAQRYADHVVHTSQAYGEAILYYARGRCIKQLQTTIDLLICTCLVQSTVFPAGNKADEQLAALLSDQRELLQRLAGVDTEAAQLITKHLSGYATLLRFYDLRDESLEEEDQQARFCKKSGLRPRARKREALKALLVLVQSAANSISGGLYDAEADAVIQVDCLLLLLGETLPLLGPGGSHASRAQLMTLLRSIEDLETVTPRVYEQAQAMFTAAMADYNGEKPQVSNGMRKSILSISSYGMVDSNGSLESETSHSGGSDEQKRGWDWRKGVTLAMGKKATGADVLRVLRVQIAKDLARVLTDDMDEL